MVINQMKLPVASLAAAPAARKQLFDHKYTAAFVMVTALFFLWAIPNNLNDVLIRQFMKSFQMNRIQAGLVQSAFYLGYFFASIPAAMFLRRFGYRKGLITGLLFYATGSMLFWPAAEVNQYAFFLFALFVIAIGLAFLETGAGSFITQLGDPATSEQRLNLAQAFNPPGTITGALIGTVFIFSGVELSAAKVSALQNSGEYTAYLHHETLRVIAPYLILSCAVFLMALALRKVNFPPEAPRLSTTAGKHGSAKRLLHDSHFIQAVNAQFFYVGAQVGTWSYLIFYIQDYLHYSLKTAGYFLSGTLAVFALGRFVSTYLMSFVAPNKLMGIYGLANIVLLGVAIKLPGAIGLFALMLTSFFMSLMYPTIFALGVKELGEDTTLGSSVLVMGIIGGAVFTPLIGWLYEASKSMATALWIPLACYGVVAHFAFVGHRIRTTPVLTKE
jgi:FHS family L-fucose permease-like MFS transporter